MESGVSPDQLYDAVTRQHVEIVLTAHPTQVNRRTLQHKHTRIATLLAQVGPGLKGLCARWGWYDVGRDTQLLLARPSCSPCVLTNPPCLP